MPQALANPPTVAASYWLAKMCIEEGIPGDFVECGVFCGSQCAAMARAIMDSGETGRRVHLFDSFQGIPKPGPHDNDIRPLLEGSAEPVSMQTVEQVRGHMERWGVDPAMLVYHPGWFEDTVHNADVERIALLRLDGDLYSSTKVCIEHLYPKLGIGGWVIVDDWNLDGARKAVQELLGPQHIYFQRQK